MIPLPSYSEEELEADRLRAIDNFRRERLQEPLEDYLEHFDAYQGVVEDLLETTVDLVALKEAARSLPAPENEHDPTPADPRAQAVLNDLITTLLSSSRLLEAFRYVAGPPISTDDLKVIADTTSLLPGSLRRDQDLARRIADVILTSLDRRRFPWISEDREPTEDERSAAVLASAGLLAMRRMEAARRSTGKNQQEQRVEDEFLRGGLVKVATRKIDVLTQAPRAGEFCRESPLGGRKADFVVGLWDQRVLALECKVSNSATNSVKRLNNDAAAKAAGWLDDYGSKQVIPAAVLAGVFKLHNLVDAQSRGLTLFWEHDLAKLIGWINATRVTPLQRSALDARSDETAPNRD